MGPSLGMKARDDKGVDASGPTSGGSDMGVAVDGGAPEADAQARKDPHGANSLKEPAGSTVAPPGGVSPRVAGALIMSTWGPATAGTGTGSMTRPQESWQ